MKKLFASLILLCVMLVAKGAESDVDVAKGLVHRIAPQYENLIDFRQISSSADVFRLESKGGKTVISGNNANSMAVGLNHFLKYYCHADVGWIKSDTYTLPAQMPKVSKPVTIKARVKDRFFLNYCTFGYTMPCGSGMSGSISSTGWL